MAGRRGQSVDGTPLASPELDHLREEISVVILYTILW